MQNSEITLNFEIKALSDREFEGYGSVFNNLDLTGDVVAPGAFKGSLSEHKSAGTMPLMFWMHKPDHVPGAWVSMREDARGLSVKGVLAQTPLGDEMRSLLGIKALRGLSIGFRTRDAEWIDDEERGAYRVIKEVDLVEVSLVSLAANPLAEVTAAKSRLSSDGVYVPSVRETEQMMRKAGFSKYATRSMMTKLFGSSGMPDPNEEIRSGGTPELEDFDLARLLNLAEKLKEPAVEAKPLPFWRS
jgi:uncharacterized protein